MNSVTISINNFQKYQIIGNSDYFKLPCDNSLKNLRVSDFRVFCFLVAYGVRNNTSNFVTPMSIAPAETKLNKIIIVGSLQKLKKLGYIDFQVNDIKQENQSFALEILNYWNSKGIIKHKVRDSTLTQLDHILDKKQMDYSIDEIKQAFDNYANIFFDNSSFFKYKWTLREFLTRANCEKFYGENFVKENYYSKSFQQLEEERLQAKQDAYDEKHRRDVERFLSGE